MEYIYRPIHDGNIEKFLNEVNTATIELQKDLVALLGGGYSIEEMTPVIDTALDCIAVWNDNLEMDLFLSMKEPVFQTSQEMESIIINSSNNMCFLRAQYEALKSNGRYYNKRYRILSYEKPLSEHSKTGSHGPYSYCIEYNDRPYPKDEITEKVFFHNWDIDSFKYNQVFKTDKNRVYKVHTYIHIGLKQSVSLKDMKEAFPKAKVYRGNEAYNLYKRLIEPGFGPAFTPMLMKGQRWYEETGKGYLSYTQS